VSMMAGVPVVQNCPSILVGWWSIGRRCSRRRRRPRADRSGRRDRTSAAAGIPSRTRSWLSRTCGRSLRSSQGPLGAGLPGTSGGSRSKGMTSSSRRRRRARISAELRVVPTGRSLKGHRARERADSSAPPPLARDDVRAPAGPHAIQWVSRRQAIGGACGRSGASS